MLFGCSRGAGARATEKPGGRSNLLPRHSVSRGLACGTPAGTPRAQDGAPPCDSAPRGAAGPGLGHLMAVLQQRQSSGKGKESGESRRPGLATPGDLACPSRPSQSLGSRRREAGSVGAGAALAQSSAAPLPGAGDGKTGVSLPAWGRGATSAGCRWWEDGQLPVPAVSAAPALCIAAASCLRRVGGRVPSPCGGQRPPLRRRQRQELPGG